MKAQFSNIIKLKIRKLREKENHAKDTLERTHDLLPPFCQQTISPHLGTFF